MASGGVAQGTREGTREKAGPEGARALPRRPAVRRLAAFLSGWLRNHLFRPTAGGPVGWRKIAIAIAVVLAATAVSLARTTGPGALNTTWIEDARDLLDQALNRSFLKCLSDQLNGYYQEPARVFTEIAVQFPLRYVPGIMSAFAAMEYALYGLIAYVASAPHLRSRWLRLLVAAPVCVIPVGYTQANNDLVTVQFIALYGAFWTLVWIPGTRAGKVIAPVAMLGIATTTVLVVVYAPLVAARLLADRSKSALCIAGIWLAGAGAQFFPTVFGFTNRVAFGLNSPVWVLRNYVAKAVPRALFGEGSLGGPGADYRGNPIPLHIISHAGHLALIGGAWLVVAAALIIALARLTDANWPLAVTAALFSVGVFAGENLINKPLVQPRYVIAPALLLYVALAAALRPRGTAPEAGSAAPEAAGPAVAGTRRGSVPAVLSWYPVVTVAVILAVAVTLNYRVINGRTTSPPWTGVVTQARDACTEAGISSYTYAHEWWQVHIPCRWVGSLG